MSKSLHKPLTKESSPFFPSLITNHSVLFSTKFFTFNRPQSFKLEKNFNSVIISIDQRVREDSGQLE
jgi:hypothetical protein